VWILTFIETNNYSNVIWFVDVVTIVGYLTWMSGYWVMLLLVMLSSLILPAIDATNYSTFKDSEGAVLSPGTTEGVLSVLIYIIVVAVDTVVQLLWVDCLRDWKAWAQFEVDKKNGLITPLIREDAEVNDTPMTEEGDVKEDEEFQEIDAIKGQNEEPLMRADDDFTFEDASQSAVGHWDSGESTWN
jgi:hypothetical protein